MAQGAVAGRISACEHFQLFCRAGKRYAWFVLGYNWLVSLTMLVVILPVVVPVAMSGPLPVSYLSCAIYVILEVAGFCLERGWSRVGLCRFWSIAGPICIVQVCLCLFVVPHDPLGCLLMSALCLGFREMLFELCNSSVSVGGYGLKERFVSALVGGFAYSALVSFLCVVAFGVVRLTQGSGVQFRTLQVIYLVVLPITRILLRMLITQSASGSVLGMSLTQTHDAGGRGQAPFPSLDARVLHSDVEFGLAIFLEVPLALVVLLAPGPITFCIAVFANALLDILFAYTLDALQQRRLATTQVTTPRGTPTSALAGWQHSVAMWSPRFCVERPVSFVATLLSGAGPLGGNEKNEKDHLRPASPRDAEGNKGKRSGPGATLGSMWSTSGIDAEGRKEMFHQRDSGAMSPRVSHLLDEYDAAVIDCQMGRGGGQSVYLFQDRKLSLTAHLLGSTAALCLATVACVFADVRSHGLGLPQIAVRVAVFFVVRAFTDIVACWALERSSLEVHQHGRAGLWESRHELANFHGWMYRALVGIGAILAALAATPAGSGRIPSGHVHWGGG